MNDDENVVDNTNDDDLGEDTEEVTEPTKTFKVENGRIQTTVDGYSAMVQAIDKILKTERFVYPIYDENYGHDFTDLIAKNSDYVYTEIERMLHEALEADDRVTDVVVNDIELTKHSIQLTANISTIFGQIPINEEVAQ